MSYRIIFMGTPEFSVPVLQGLQKPDFETVLVISQPDRPKGRKQEIVPTPVAAKAKELGLPLWQPEKVKNQAFLDRIREEEPDFIVTAAYGRILTSEVLQVPRFGSVNVHASLLPKYRGASPVHWAIINGDKETGVSIMLMDEQMDHGAILARFCLEIPLDVTTDKLMDRLGELGAVHLPDVLLGYAEGSVKPEIQDESQATYVKLLTREDGRIDWNQTSTEVHNRIRGTYPWPGAYTTMDGKRLKIHQSLPEANPDGLIFQYGKEPVPGTVIFSKKDHLAVACGEGVLNLLELQPAGSRRLRAEDISHNILPGTVLGIAEQENA